MKKLAMVCAALLLVAGLAEAQVIGPAGFQQTIKLQPTPAGKLIRAQGVAGVRATREFESFGIKVEAKVEDGTRFMVVVTSNQTQIMVGMIEMVFGGGSLRIVQPVGGPGLPPVQSITGVSVSDLLGGVILEGKFGQTDPRQ